LSHSLAQIASTGSDSVVERLSGVRDVVPAQIESVASLLESFVHVLRLLNASGNLSGPIIVGASLPKRGHQAIQPGLALQKKNTIDWFNRCLTMSITNFTPISIVSISPGSSSLLQCSFILTVTFSGFCIPPDLILYLIRVQICMLHATDCILSATKH
jgi:hypothetical protein